MRLQSQVVITTKLENTVLYLKSLAKNNEKFITIYAKTANFSVDEAKLAIEKAYLASKEQTYLLLCAEHFSPVVQNKLLKIIEEPPKNKSFMLLVASKSSILPTIYSRLPVHVVRESSERLDLGLDVRKLDIKEVYKFIQKNSRVSSGEAKKIIEAISIDSIKSKKYNLDQKLLQTMHDSVVALDKGSPASFVLTGLLLKMLALKKRSAKRS